MGDEASSPPGLHKTAGVPGIGGLQAAERESAIQAAGEAARWSLPRVAYFDQAEAERAAHELEWRLEQGGALAWMLERLDLAELRLALLRACAAWTQLQVERTGGRPLTKRELERRVAALEEAARILADSSQPEDPRDPRADQSVAGAARAHRRALRRREEEGRRGRSEELSTRLLRHLRRDLEERSEADCERLASLILEDLGEPAVSDAMLRDRRRKASRSRR